MFVYVLVTGSHSFTFFSSDCVLVVNDFINAKLFKADYTKFLKTNEETIQ